MTFFYASKYHYAVNDFRSEIRTFIIRELTRAKAENNYYY